jgi:hypothetical protein
VEGDVNLAGDENNLVDFDALFRAENGGAGDAAGPPEAQLPVEPVEWGVIAAVGLDLSKLN